MEVLLVFFLKLVVLTNGLNNTSIGIGGIIKYDRSSNIIINRDSLVVTIVYDLAQVKGMWNSYISESEALIQSIGTNKCLSKVLSDSITSRVLIRNFLAAHRSENRVTRQAMLGILSGLSSLVGLGLTTYEIGRVNNKIAQMKKVTDSDHGKLLSMSSVVSFNSKQILQLNNLQVHTSEVLGRMRNTVNQNVQQINQLTHNMLCLSMKVTYIKLSTMIEKIMVELKDILEGNFNIDILTSEVRQKICSNMAVEGFLTYTNCVNFDLITETNHLLLENKLIILTKIPIRSSMDVFQLTQFIPLPIKYKEHYVKANLNKFNYYAIGSVYRTNIDYKHCTKIQSDLFCKANDAYINVKDDKTCVGAIMHNSESIFEKCEFNIVKMENTFLHLEGNYFYSIEGQLEFEVICVDSLLNDKITLVGMGSIMLKLGCYAKSNNILLAGNNKYTLNGSYSISHQGLFGDQWDFVNISKFSNLISKDFPDSNPTPLSNINVENHIYIIYITLLIIGIMMFIFIIFKLIKFICIDRSDIKVGRAKSNVKEKIPRDTKIAKNKNEKQSQSTE